MPNSKKNRAKKAAQQNASKGAGGSLPAARSNTTRQRPAKFRQSATTITVTHREFIGDVDQLNETVVIQATPTSSRMFPWLNRMAPLYEKYKVLKAAFLFKTMSGTVVPGSMTMAFDYDPRDVVKPSKQTMLQYETSTSGSLWSNLRLDLVQSRVSEELYLDPIDSKNNPRLSRFGALCYHATTIDDHPHHIGQLWVEYTIQLISPQLEPAPTARAYATYLGSEFDMSDLTKWRDNLVSYFSQEVEILEHTGSKDRVDVRFKRPGLYAVQALGMLKDAATFESPTLETSDDATLGKVGYHSDQWKMASEFRVWVEQAADNLLPVLTLSGGKGLGLISNFAVQYIGQRLSDFTKSSATKPKLFKHNLGGGMSDFVKL